MNYYVTLSLILLLYASVWFVISLIKKRNDVADTAWGLGFVTIAWLSFFIAGQFNPRGILVGILISIWGVRLAWHISARHKGQAEDYRYLAWRREWGCWFYIRSYLQVYLLQMALLLLIAWPVLIINENSAVELGWLDFLGAFIWLIGFLFEVIGDAQLAQFKSDPASRGKLMQKGLWAYTRHPNYFGEVTLWWGVWFLAIAVPGGWLSILGPLTITFLILKVSGIPMLEKKMEKSPEFLAYKKRVSIFFPLPPRA